MNTAEYVDYLRGKGYADRTTEEYRRWLRRLTMWCTERGLDPATLEPHLLRDWADRLPFSWSTRKQARAAVRHYYQAIGRGPEAPWEAIRTPRKPNPRPDPHERSEAILLRDAALMHGGRKGLAVLGLLYTGARPSEVAVWRWEHVDLRRGRIGWHRPKVSDLHELPIPPQFATALEDARPWPAVGPIFGGNNARMYVNAATIWTWTKQIAGMVGLETSPKRLRATVGSLILDATGDLDAAAEILGHSSTDTTRAYYVGERRGRVDRAVGSLPY